MKTNLLLLGVLIVSITNCFSATVLHDFENDITMTGWESDVAIVANPSQDNVNSSSNCEQITFSANYGRVAAYGLNVDLIQNGFSVKVYAENLGEVSVYVDGAGDYPGVSQAILAEGKWVQLYFDFTGLATSATQVQIGTGTTNTIYIDDVQIVPLSDFPSSVCTGEMEVDYSYGQVAIGGGGFVSGLIAHPTDKDVKFARTDVGGAYKWNASNCSWKPLNSFISADDKGLLSIEALAVDPKDSENIYMLGGCMYFSNEKTAIMYSRDGGESFSTVDVSALIKAHGNGNGRGNGERLAVDPHNSNIIYCGGRAGAPLIMSTDAGETWSAVSSFPAEVYSETTKWPTYDSWTPNPTMWPTTPNLNGTSAVVFDGSSVSGGKTQRIFVGISRTGADNVYISEDGGSSWSAVSGLPTKWMPLRMKMDPDGNVLITYSDKEGPNNCGSEGGIYRYNPNTQTAENISPPGNFPIGDVSFSSTNADSLVCTTICTWVNQDWGTGNTVHGDIIFTSIDGGATWRSLQDNFEFDANGCTWIPDHSIHWSCSILMDPFDNKKVSVTSGNGIFTTNNIWCEAEEGPTFYFDVNGIEETVPLDLVSVPGGDLFSVIGDYTGFRHTDIHSFPPIHKPESHTTGGIAYASLNTDIMARVAHSSYYSEDGGDTWEEMKGAPTVSDASYSEVAISADGSTILYLPAETGSPVYSTDKGNIFNTSSGCSTAGYVVADPVNANYFYAGGEDVVYISKDKGKTFSSTQTGNGEYTRLCVVPDHEGLLYLPKGSNGLAVSNDHGASFSTVPFVTSCEAVGVGKGKTADTYVLYIWGKANGCKTGIYRSEDEGASWQRINDETKQFGGIGNGKFIVGDQNVYGRFYMATVGMGIVYGELSSSATAPSWSCFVDETECAVESNVTEQTISLQKGWNLVSFYVSPTNSLIGTVFPNAEIVKTFDSFWKSNQAAYLNSLVQVSVGEGYLVYNSIDETITISGAVTGQINKPVLDTGWNLIGVPFSEPSSFETVLGNNLDNVLIIKDLDYFWENGDAFNTLEDLLPGKAYFVKRK